MLLLNIACFLAVLTIILLTKDGRRHHHAIHTKVEIYLFQLN